MKHIYACIAVILVLCSGVLAAGPATSKGAEMVWVLFGRGVI